jgi:transposase
VLARAPSPNHTRRRTRRLKKIETSRALMRTRCTRPSVACHEVLSLVDDAVNVMLRSIDRFIELSSVRRHLTPYYSAIGRPSIDPELMIRMLLVGYSCGIRSERRLCEEVHLNLAYRWFCGLGLDGAVPDHSTFYKNRHGRFRDSDLLRELFTTIVRRCIAEGIVGGEGFAVDGSMIPADARRQNGVAAVGDLNQEDAGRAVKETLTVLDDAAFGGATDVPPKFDLALESATANSRHMFMAFTRGSLPPLGVGFGPRRPRQTSFDTATNT